jgi:hypothetical protein
VWPLAAARAAGHAGLAPHNAALEGLKPAGGRGRGRTDGGALAVGRIVVHAGPVPEHDALQPAALLQADVGDRVRLVVVLPLLRERLVLRAGVAIEVACAPPAALG